jgi:UDPglucose--hexose-1-phosphate uridylyltransferase
MRDLGFKKEITTGYYLDPFNNFQEKKITIELRYDDITGVACRILPYRMRITQKPDMDSYLEKSPESLCSFCPDLFEKTTPRFTSNIIEEGNFKRGEARLFPNAFPYDQNNNVAIFSSRHFVPMNELTPEFMRDGVAVCRDYFHRVVEMNLGYKYCSINWNYMPPAGGGLIHPHLQTIVSYRPTNFMQKLLSSAQNYAAVSNGDNLWGNLIALEKKADKRFIANTGVVCWLTSFAPKGMAGEIDFIFREKTSFFDLTESNFNEFLTGLSRVFSYFYTSNFISFNMSFYATMTNNNYFYVQGKIIPRFVINPLGTSDLNYFEKLHNEIICPTVPEELCREIQPYFKAAT